MNTSPARWLGWLPVLAVIILATGAQPRSAEAKPKYTVKTVMQTINKGPDAIVRKAMKGQASKEELTRMVEYYAALPLNSPPQGDPGSWKQQAESLLKAAQGIQQGDPKALEALKKPDTCTVCHKAHRAGLPLGQTDPLR